MANPSPSVITALDAKVPTLPGGWTGNTDAAIAVLLNTPSVVNPSPQATIPKPYTVASVLSLITTSAANLKADPFLAVLTDVRDRIQAADTAGVVLYGQLLLGWGVITQVEHDLILSAVTATQPDPNYQAEISWAMATINRPIDAADVAAARPTQ